MNAPPITVDDFKNVLLDLYLVQRENALLRAELEAGQDAAAVGEEATDD